MQTQTSQNKLLLAYKTCNNKSNHSRQIVSKDVEHFPPKRVKTKRDFFQPNRVKTRRFLETVKQQQQQSRS